MKEQEKTDLSLEWNKFLNNILIVNSLNFYQGLDEIEFEEEKNIIDYACFAKMPKNDIDCHPNSPDIYEIIFYESNILKRKLRGVIMFYPDTNIYEWLIKINIIFEKNSFAEFRGNSQKTFKDCSNQMVEKAKIICKLLKVSFPKLP